MWSRITRRSSHLWSARCLVQTGLFVVLKGKGAQSALPFRLRGCVRSAQRIGALRVLPRRQGLGKRFARRQPRTLLRPPHQPFSLLCPITGIAFLSNAVQKCNRNCSSPYQPRRHGPNAPVLDAYRRSTPAVCLDGAYKQSCGSSNSPATRQSGSIYYSRQIVLTQPSRSDLVCVLQAIDDVAAI